MEGYDILGIIDKGNVNVVLIGLYVCCWYLFVLFYSFKIFYLLEKGILK